MKKIIIVLLLLLSLSACKQPQRNEQNDIFEEGLLAVSKNGYYGYINEKGEEIIPFIFNRATAFYRGIAIVQDNQSRANLINKQGELLVENGYTTIYRDNDTKFFIVVDEDKYGLLDIKGDIIVDLIYDDIEPFYEGLAVVKKDNKYGYINTHGEIVIEPTYAMAKRFSHGLAAVLNNELWGYINPKNEVVIDFQYSYASHFDDSARAVVTVLDQTLHKYYLIDASNHKYIEDAYSIRGDGPIYAVATLDGSYLYKPDGSRFVETKFDTIHQIEDYYMHADLVNQTVFIYYKSNGEIIQMLEHDTQLIYIRHHFEEQMVLQSVENGSIHIFLDEKEIILESLSLLQVLSEDLFVTQNQTYQVGIMNTKGEIIVDFIYDSLYQGADGYLITRANGYYGFLNSQYETIVPPIYQNVWHWYNISNFGQPHQ